MADDTPTPEPAPLLISAARAAALLNIGPTHFYGLIRMGKLGPQGIRLGRSVRWRADELRDWVTAGCPRREVWEAQRNADFKGNRR
jgi:excisionase family DNA binding protein